MTNRVGQQLGNYQLISHLGEGGFAEVYLGEHVHLGTQAAIKVLHTQLARDDMEQFRTEARTIAHLEHPHIVRILDFGVEDKTPFLVMSYAPNGTLRERHSRGERVLRIVDTVRRFGREVSPQLVLDRKTVAL
jgi:serine/threonine protein kinase